MKKNYEEPELIVRNYLIKPTDVVMTSDPTNNGGNDLFDDDIYDVLN